MVADAPPFGAVWEDVNAFVGAALAARGDDAVALWVAHNARFDCRMLGGELGRLAAAMAKKSGKTTAPASKAASTVASSDRRPATRAGASPASVMTTATTGDEGGDTPAKAVAPAAASPAVLPPSWRFACSMQAFKVAYPALPSYRQEAVAAHVGVVNEAAHRALGDVAALDAILRHAAGRLPGGIEGFWGDKLGASLCTGVTGAAAAVVPAGAVTDTSKPRALHSAMPAVDLAPLRPGETLFMTSSAVYHSRRSCPMLSHAAVWRATVGPPPPGRRLCFKCKRDDQGVAAGAGGGGVATA
ncbi:hypothetical protein I4F81_006259 [Pyropia yezoensis]|uniref:Uncharacterized protein n=1 Tax=Pyropia yezoensis TaxID=2788 RepID=A0ACC3C128_PYRYE|nr:hypothetical protein I4F81_006259 [Neopyropia yezoensis]